MHARNLVPSAGDWTFVRADSYGEDDSPSRITRGVSFDDATHLLFCDPHGTLHLVAVRGKGKQPNGASWILTGTMDAPTLSPSIKSTSWQGWLENGELRDASTPQQP